MNDRQTHRLGSTLLVGYGAGAFGALLGFALVPLLLLYYLTEVAGLPPVWAGVVLAVPKISDLLLDPWLGRKTDAFASANRGRASVLLFSAVVLPLLLVLLFIPLHALPLAARAVVFAILLTTQSLLTTVFAVAHTALAGDIAPTLGARGTLISARSFGATTAGLVVAGVAPALVSRFGNAQPGYLGMGAVLAVASMLFLLLSWLTCRGTPMREGTGDVAAKTKRLIPALRATLQNRAFYVVAAMLVLIGIGSGSLVALMPYVNQYLLQRTPAELPALMLPVFFVLLAGVLVAPWLLKKAGPGNALLFSLVIALAGIVVLAGGPRRDISMAIGAGLFGLGAGLLTVLILTLATETATRSQAAGESLGLYLGVLFSAEKMGASISVLLTGFGLDWVGVRAGNAPGPTKLGALWLWLPLGALLACFALLAMQRRAIFSLR
ncbi:MFS transporter [Stenotrophomonas sp. PD6]|uniref:MFS transporter n=1 Tax=Stenotrophomonas sp. PD6 TaxID=3368612 RepID=UPI003B9F6F3A